MKRWLGSYPTRIEVYVTCAIISCIAGSIVCWFGIRMAWYPMLERLEQSIDRLDKIAAIQPSHNSHQTVNLDGGEILRDKRIRDMLEHDGKLGSVE